MERLRDALCRRAQFMAAFLTKQLVDKLMTVTIVGKPAPEIKDLVYYQAFVCLVCLNHAPGAPPPSCAHALKAGASG